jgi:AraC family transcriptional regulator, regulatory protein of adaptative response / methylated-DNA-[protein]-cysteine methyltransferase
MVRTPAEALDTLTPAADEARWAAVVARDSRFDGSFFYSVATTGVYCLPSCPARPAKRVNVRFHATCAGAEAAGFRPCKRCKPTGDRSHEGQPEPPKKRIARRR